MSKDKIIMYAPEGELHDSVQASGVLDISDLSRKEIKNLAKKAAGWSGENGTFSWQDVASGQADIQGKFTRHEDLFKRKFNKQLEKNLHYTEQQQLLQAAKDGNPEAMGQYVASKTTDVAPAIGAVTLLPATILTGLGTGAFAAGANLVKSFYANPWLRFASDLKGTYDGVTNYFSNDGIQKTIRLGREGDVYGAIKSGVGDVFDIVSIVDLPFSFLKFKNFKPSYNFKYATEIGDGGTRFQTINDMDIDRTYKRYINDGIVDEHDLPEDLLGSNTKITKSALDDYIFLSDGIYGEQSDAQWLINNLKGKTAEEASAFLSEIANPKSRYYNKFVSAAKTSYLNSFVTRMLSKLGKRKIVAQGRGIEKALDFVDKTMIARNPLFSPKANVIEQIKAGVSKYHRPKWRFNFNGKLSDSRNTYDGKDVVMGWSPSNRGFLTADLSWFKTDAVAAHEGAHSNRFVNNPNTDIFLFDPYFQNMTDTEKKVFLRKIRPDSPRYGYDYSRIPKRHKQLMTPSKKVNDHDFEFNEGYSDAMATRYNMFNKGISSAALDPTKRYTYLDLIRYKMTPTGMFDRFIRQRGGWWKGWKQQLDALNEVYKNGGKL